MGGLGAEGPHSPLRSQQKILIELLLASLYIALPYESRVGRHADAIERYCRSRTWLDVLELMRRRLSERVMHSDLVIP